MFWDWFDFFNSSFNNWVTCINNRSGIYRKIQLSHLNFQFKNSLDIINLSLFLHHSTFYLVLSSLMNSWTLFKVISAFSSVFSTFFRSRKTNWKPLAFFSLKRACPLLLACLKYTHTRYLLVSWWTQLNQKDCSHNREVYLEIKLEFNVCNWCK